jgi:hypothetical protein
MLTQERLREVLDYDSREGLFRWRKAISIRVRGKIGMPAGSPDRHGYPMIGIDGSRYSAHRLVWFWVYGAWPDGELDHINSDRADYRICNLRLASRSQNCANNRKPKNNTSGFKGVTWDRANKKWAAQLQVKGRHQNLGRFARIEDASAAYAQAAKAAFGEFARA